MNMDCFSHYCNAPVSGYVSTVCDRNPVTLPDELKQKCFREWGWDTQPEEAEKSIKNFIGVLEECGAQYDQVNNGAFQEAFNKFDKDGNGSIDRDEIAAVCAELDAPLEEDELEEAFKDLDTNKDGVIDMNEFRNWYFSGMKSYSAKKRTLLKFKNGAAGLSAALNDKDMAQFVKNNSETVDQSVSFSFNKPQDPGTSFQAKFNVLGQEYETWVKKAQNFLKEKGHKQVHDDELLFFAKCEIETTQEAWDEFKPILEVLNSEVLQRMSQNDHTHVDVSHDGKIIIRFCDQIPREYGDLRHAYIPAPIQ